MSHFGKSYGVTPLVGRDPGADPPSSGLALASAICAVVAKESFEPLVANQNQADPLLELGGLGFDRVNPSRRAESSLDCWIAASLER